MQGIYQMPVLPETRKAFGRKLKPLTLGHCRVMLASGIMQFRYPAQDAILASIICSMPYQQAERLIMRGSGRLLFAVWLCERVALKHGLESEIERFADYWKDSTQSVKRWKKRGEKSGKEYVPWVYTAFTRLASLSIYKSAADVWNETLFNASIICAALGVMEGDQSLVSVEEQEKIEAIRAGRMKGNEITIGSAAHGQSSN
jgi:hypothetical protein